MRRAEKEYPVATIQPWSRMSEAGGCSLLAAPLKYKFKVGSTGLPATETMVLSSSRMVKMPFVLTIATAYTTTIARVSSFDRSDILPCPFKPEFGSQPRR